MGSKFLTVLAWVVAADDWHLVGGTYHLEAVGGADSFSVRLVDSKRDKVEPFKMS